MPLKYMMNEYMLNPATCNDWANFCRQVCIDPVNTQVRPIGGPDKFVEIDESLFSKKKYNRGMPRPEQWVFGGVERGTGRCFMVPVKQRNADTLIPIITEYILPGTTIISDKWKAYNHLS